MRSIFSNFDIRISDLLQPRLMKKILITISFLAILAAPSAAFALQMPTTGNDLTQGFDITANAYIVYDAKNGQVLLGKNIDTPWTPASLTKLVTALVVLDTKTKLAKTVSMTAGDQTVGGCSVGGACIKSKPGVKFTVDGLFHAALIPSDNNAAAALARSTGLSTEAFVAKMNQKAASLGATHSHFNEPTGMDPTNSITAADYAKIVTAAFSNAYLKKIAALPTYRLVSVNNSKYTQTLKNTDKLLSDADVQMLGAKTGYLDESQYNFASLLKYRGSDNLAVVVLGDPHLYSAFSETKLLAKLGEDARSLLALQNPAQAVLGASTNN